MVITNQASSVSNMTISYRAACASYTLVWNDSPTAMIYIDGLAQDCSNSIANALELLQSCADTSICCACCTHHTWWRHQMEIFSALLAFCVGNSSVTGEFPSQRPVTRSFDVFFICAWINSRANNGYAGDLRRHCAHYDVILMTGVLWRQHGT